MIAADLTAARASTVRWFDEVSSTMDEARALAAIGAPHGQAVAAHVQSAGRGRTGRQWVSPRGNLHTTVILRPGGGACHAPELGFVVALAVAGAVDKLAGPGTALKWPNDVLRGGAKLAGVLLERMDDGAVLAGIGMNVRHVPTDTGYPVTSLVAEGCNVTVERMLDSVLEYLEREWREWQSGGFAPVLARWRQRGPALGAHIQVRLPGSIVTGLFAGLREDGALLVESTKGTRALIAGDVLL